MKVIVKSILLNLFVINMLSAQTEYLNIHSQALVVDMHTDVMLQVLRGADISKKLDYGHVDLIRMNEGGVDVQFFAIWPNPNTYESGQMFDQSIRMIDQLDIIINNNEDKVRLTRTPQEIMDAVNDDKIAACIGVEGGTAIENDLDNLQTFYDRGVRYLGLTWEDSPDWATSAKDEYKGNVEGKKGLTEFGKQVIRKMNVLGMMVDISHSGEQTFWDVMDIVTKPPIASHSCVYNQRWHYRNLKDDQIKAIAEKDGVIFINFYLGYLDYDFSKKYEALIDSSKSYLDSLKKMYGSDRLAYRKIRAEYYREKSSSFLPDIGRIIDHIDAIISLVGDDHVGLGSDFDGISITPRGIKDIADMPNLTREMIRRGYSEERIKKILGGNFMRVFQANIN